MRTIRLCGCLGLLAWVPLFAQSAPTRPAFEVASVRPHPGPIQRIDISSAGPRFTVEANTVFSLIAYAYNLKTYQVSASPNLPLSDTFYDIVAKAEGEGERTRDEFRQMLQSLLADRFKLKVHRETREMQVYALVVGKNGPKLKASPANPELMGYMRVVGRNYQVTRQKAGMDDVIQAITNSFLDRPVVDKTGLTGTYDLNLTYTPDIRANRAEPDPNDISIFTAVQEQLGLKLEPEKDNVEVLVVDSIEKPSEN